MLGDNARSTAATLQVFDGLNSSMAAALPHQRAGWTDIQSNEEWAAYVHDVIAGHVAPGSRVLEVGCGPGAFVGACKTIVPDATYGGIDGCDSSIFSVKEAVDNPEEWVVGVLPDDLARYEDGSWDCVICNSVFQYISDLDTATRLMEELLRIASRRVIVADVCDEAYAKEIHALVAATPWASNLAYLCIPQSWWGRFSGDRVDISIRRVATPTYWRREHRYVVYCDIKEALSTVSGKRVLPGSPWDDDAG